MKTFLGLILIFLPQFLLGQVNFSLKLSTVSVNFEKSINKPLLVNSLVDSGLVTFEPTGMLSFEILSNDKSPNKNSIKINQAMGKDAASQWAGFTQVYYRRLLVGDKRSKHKLLVGVGLSMFYRFGWKDLENYQKETAFEESGNFEYRIAWLSGELEYNYQFSKFSDFSLSLNHNHTFSLTIAAGFKYWLDGVRYNCGCD